MISARIIADSVSTVGIRITTMVVRFPRFILAEFNTHRKFSRNAASSRAIPTTKIIRQILEDPAMPVFWGKNQSGMQAWSEMSPGDQGVAETIWLQARDLAINKAKELLSIDCHKQVVNRILEPWIMTTVLVTATEWQNFFRLRCHPDAQPEMRVLAEAIKAEYDRSRPIDVPIGGWHIPFGDKMPEGVSESDRLKVATARAARLSYESFDNETSVSKDLELHDRLASSGHWSPFEHSAKAMYNPFEGSGNFDAWMQYRKFFPGEAGR
jgi:thymidylate synthase ThyX